MHAKTSGAHRAWPSILLSFVEVFFPFRNCPGDLGNTIFPAFVQKQMPGQLRCEALLRQLRAFQINCTKSEVFYQQTLDASLSQHRQGLFIIINDDAIGAIGKEQVGPFAADTDGNVRTFQIVQR